MTANVADDIAANLAAVIRAIEDAASAAGRPAGSAALVAVSKTHGAERIVPALRAGQRRFAENRVQEAKAKWPELKAEWPDVELHLIGPLQTNKVKEAVALFDVIETVDRPRLAEALAAEMARSGRRPRCLIEVNTGAEPQKAGIAPAELGEFLAVCRDRLGLPVDGLMCIPPQHENPALHFALLADMARRAGLRTVSMGMSADYPVAVRYGATEVRVGSAIFGAREYGPGAAEPADRTPDQ